MIDVAAESRPELPNQVALLRLLHEQQCAVPNQIVEIHFHAFNERRFAYVTDGRQEDGMKLWMAY